MKVELRSRRSRTVNSVDLTLTGICTLGSNGDICIEGDGIKDKHIRLICTEDSISVEPIEKASLSINGKKIAESTILCDGDWLALGSSLFQVKIQDTTSTNQVEDFKYLESLFHNQIDTKRIRIGRSTECELTISSPLVSRQHAVLHQIEERIVLEDLGSTNGTFVNGRRILGQKVLNPGDRIDISTFSYMFTGEALKPLGQNGLVRIEVLGLYKEILDRFTRRPKRLLDGIDFVVEPGEFVVIFGSSGSGKSTLLDSLNGRRPATGGRVLYNGSDFYACFDRFRSIIGYVPQQDIVHRKISIENALYYTARLRLAPDMSEMEVQEHIRRVLEQVGLSDKGGCAIDTPMPLSGGQLKRVSLAVELIADPNIMFLDEATSGLDAGTDKKMMGLFSKLAAGGKTVICVSHTLENIDLCHLVLLLHKGKLIYYGPPKQALNYFEVARLSEVYDLIETKSADDWATRFKESSVHHEFVAKRHARICSTPEHVPGPGQRGTRHTNDAAQQGQTRILTRRYLDLLFSDKRNLIILLIQAPLIGVVVGLVFDSSGSAPERLLAENQMAFLLVISTIWIGCLNSTREIVKELPIYLRERAVNLSIRSYLLSKLCPLAVFGALQCFALLGITTLLVSWEGPFFSRLLALFVSTMAATVMGLAVSTLVDTNDKAVAIVPMLLIPQVILSNFVVPLGAIGEHFAHLTIIAFSSFRAVKNTLQIGSVSATDVCNSFWKDLGWITMIGCGFLIVAFLGLKLKDRKRAGS